MYIPPTEPTTGNAAHRALMTSVGAPSFADAIAFIEGNPDCPPVRRRNLISSLRTMAEIIGLPPDAIACECHSLRGHIDKHHPIQAGISFKRWSNIRSDVVTVMITLGRHAPRPPRNKHLGDAWQPLFDAVLDKHLQLSITRFVAFCSGVGVVPGDVTDDIVVAFGRMLEERTLLHHRKLVRMTASAWNKIAVCVPGWPAVKLSSPRAREAYVLPLDAFPESLQGDVRLWLRRVDGSDMLDIDSAPIALRPASIKTRLFQLRQAASALVHQGTDPSGVTSLTTLVTPAAVKSILEFFLERSRDRKTSQIHALATFLTSVARHHCKVDEKDLECLRRLCRKVHPGRQGMTEKNRRRLRPFDDERAVGRLLDLPRKLMAQANAGKLPPKTAANRAMAACIIEILLMAPLRRANLLGLNLERHLQRHGRGRRISHITIPANEVKNGEELTFPVPAESSKLIEFYITKYRPALVEAPNSWLFPCQGNRHRSETGLAELLATNIRRETGLQVNPHVFRHLAAKFFLDENPGQYEIVRRMLGHKSIETTIRFYCGLESAAAARHFDETILKVRARTAPLARWRRQRAKPAR